MRLELMEEEPPESFEMLRRAECDVVVAFSYDGDDSDELAAGMIRTAAAGRAAGTAGTGQAPAGLACRGSKPGDVPEPVTLAGLADRDVDRGLPEVPGYVHRDLRRRRVRA